MHDAVEFHRAILPLLERVGMAEAHDPQSIAVTLSIDESLIVGLLGHQPGFLVVVAELPEPVDTGDAQRLLLLLEANQFTAEHPPLIGSVQSDSGRFSLWTRQPLAELDEASVLALFERLLAAASAVRDWLDVPLAQAGAPATVSGGMRV